MVTPFLSPKGYTLTSTQLITEWPGTVTQVKVDEDGGPLSPSPCPGYERSLFDRFLG